MTSLTIDTSVTKDCCRISGDFEILRRSGLFSGINHEVIKLFAYLSIHRTYNQGDYLIQQEKNADKAFLLVKGSVDITVMHREREITLQQITGKSIFGELCLLARFQWFFNARAADDVEVIVIDRTAFQKVIEKYPEHKDTLTERVIQLRVDRLVDQTTYMLDQIKADAELTAKNVI